ncbi:nucleoside 2-deoxyribosyltransferase [Pigmentiphaga aceris]|uniref:Nucleoside 2-deoxyribosyltransferase n=1 Tax=Pigmentiphaga aceris TaxID=1940612 RepID=A0A5C0B6R7_9BURK|nr:nucleoside 2-deoxyribosyltransferase [Pigmentiphaga aceris]QEI08651.1 nucleoside 2-deoxyribosyltransferase [Pigmentiphaga aceris]
MKKIYLAGPDVFRPDALAWGHSLKALCREFGFEGLYPLDNAAPAGLSGPALATWIFEANIVLIRQCDLVMANLQAFRGYEPDSGTAFEVGFAAALGKPVWGYHDPMGSLRDQVPQVQRPDGLEVDADGQIVEDFGLSRNLMLACSATIVEGDARDCLTAIRQAD